MALEGHATMAALVAFVALVALVDTAAPKVRKLKPAGRLETLIRLGKAEGFCPSELETRTVQ